MDIPRLEEQLKTIRNLCDISLAIIDKPPLLPTILEILCMEAENMVITQCAVDDTGADVEVGLKIL